MTKQQNELYDILQEMGVSYNANSDDSATIMNEFDINEFTKKLIENNTDTLPNVITTPIHGGQIIQLSYDL